MIKKIKTTIILLLLLFCYSDYIHAITNSNEEVSKRRFSWEKVEGAVKYRIQILDIGGKVVIDKIVETNQIDFQIPFGEYRIRIGAINKFDKIGSWSDWADIKIIKHIEPVKKEDSVLQDMDLKFGVGIPYFQLLSEWKELYDNSYSGATMNIGYYLGNSVYFKSVSFIRNTGLEIEGSFVRFDSKGDQNIIENNLRNIIAGCNLYYTTRFTLPIDLILRVGSGITHTKMRYDDSDNSDDSDEFISKDDYYKIGLSLEYRFIRSFYLESGIDYYIIRYLSSNLKSMRYYCLIGMRM